MSAGYEVEEYGTSSVSELGPFFQPAVCFSLSMTMSCPRFGCAYTMAVGAGQLCLITGLPLTPGTSSTSTGFTVDDKNHAGGHLVFVTTAPGLAIENFSPPTPRYNSEAR